MRANQQQGGGPIGRRIVWTGATLGVLSLLGACGGPGGDEPPTLRDIATAGSTDPDSDIETAGPMLVREPDLREPERAEAVPPPIHGGTLRVLSDGNHVVVGDADRHRIVGVTLDDGAVVFDLDVGEGSLPGRSVEDIEGRVHVVLRGSGELLTLMPEDGEEVRRMQVCAEPRGLAYDVEAGALHLACADGTLWTYAADTGEVLGEIFVARDLRDVALADQGALWVSTFRAARVFRVEPDGTVQVLPPLPAHEQELRRADGSRHQRFFSARAAWRMVSDAQGAAYLVHQRATHDAIEIEPHAEPVPDEHVAEAVSTPLEQVQLTNNSYGGGAEVLEGERARGCDAIVHSAITVVEPEGGFRSSPPIGGTVLPVDLALSPLGRDIAVVSAGLMDPGAPKAKVVSGQGEMGDASTPCVGCEGGLSGVTILPTFDFSLVGVLPSSFLDDSCLLGEGITGVAEPAVAVAFLPGTEKFLVQVREPSRLYLLDASRGEALGRIELDGEPVADTGHDLFHRDSGGGIACASCHLEGAEDGHTWRFTGLGLRRTQPLNVRLRGTEPFHWDGAMEGLGAIMSTVFVERMGGVPQSPERLEALRDWVLDLRPRAPVRGADDAAALRGKALFESDDVGCARCHGGPKLTNNESVDVGTSDGVPLQVPSLRGVAHRLPLMHDGCAQTLAQRFEPDCGGGDSHGQTSQLSPEEIADLVAYLETL